MDGISVGIEFIKPNKKNENGFTLIELMVAMLIAGIVLSAIYSAFKTQQRSYLAQDQVAEMQQNLRAGINLMTREIRMAGYDPNGTGNYGITSASSSAFNFTADINEDGGVPGSGETFLYELYDSDGDGNDDALRRTPGGSAVAENIEQIEFYYTMEDGSNTLVPGNVNNIRSVRITVLAKSDRIDPDFTHNATYETASGNFWTPVTDRNCRRRLLTTSVQCRNMGL